MTLIEANYSALNKLDDAKQTEMANGLVVELT